MTKPAKVLVKKPPQSETVPKRKEKKPPLIEPLILQGVFEAKPNKLFSERQRAAVRFLRYSSAVPCAECGRMSKHHWSMIVAFQAKIFPKGIGGFIQSHGMVHLPLTPVCRDHLLQELDKPTYMRPYIEPTKTKKPRKA